jgi:hypothetical protein
MDQGSEGRIDGGGETFDLGGLEVEVLLAFGARESDVFVS